MTAWLERIGLTEFFAFLFPGLMILSSVSLWAEPKPTAFVGGALASQPLLIAIVVIVLAYALGLMVGTLSWEGSVRYIFRRYAAEAGRTPTWGYLLKSTLDLLPRIHLSFRGRPVAFTITGWLRVLKSAPGSVTGFTWPRALRALGSIRAWVVSLFYRLWDYLSLVALLFFGWLPLRLEAWAFAQVSNDIQDSLADIEDSGVTAVRDTVIRSVWELLDTYRLVVSGALEPSTEPVLVECRAIHLRLLFGLGAGLALLVIAAQAVARLMLFAIAKVTPPEGTFAVWVSERPGNLPLLTAAVVIGLLAGFVLRWVAGRWWEMELLLTHSLALSARPRSQPE